MSMREKKKPENRRKPYTKPTIKREALEKLNPFSNAKLRPNEELDSSLKQKAGPDYPQRRYSPFSPPNPRAGPGYDYREHSVEYDPKTGKPRYKGQKSDSESSKRTVSEEALILRRKPEKRGERPRGNAEYRYRNPILDIWNAKIDTENVSRSGFKITPERTLDEKQRELARKIYSQEWDRLFDEEKGKVPFLSRLANGKALIQRYKEHVAKELGKDVEDVTREDIEKSLLAYWNFDTKPEPERVRWWGYEDSEPTEQREPEKKKTHPERAKERFDDFMREKPKDPKDSS